MGRFGISKRSVLAALGAANAGMVADVMHHRNRHIRGDSVGPISLVKGWVVLN
jgi:hypothetical protein